MPPQSATPRLIVRRTPSQNPCFDEMLGNSLSLRMMQIPGGQFTMGSSVTEPDRFDDEGPQHPVSIQPFFMGKYPITQAQWRYVSALPPMQRSLQAAPSRFYGDNNPVEQVSLYDATEFCVRLSVHTGKQYYLPSEAQWEYACRAKTTTPFHFGETITTDLANYRGTDDSAYEQSGSYGVGPKGEYREKTMPVGSFTMTNAFGLCDMHGNVWEWCTDHWHDTYDGAPADGRAWLTDQENVNYVVRGGSWIDFPRNCRSASRDSFNPDVRYNSFGFRVCCMVPQTIQPTVTTVEE